VVVGALLGENTENLCAEITAFFGFFSFSAQPFPWTLPKLLCPLEYNEKLYLQDFKL